MRVFIGIPASEALIRFGAKLTTELQALVHRVSWVDPQNYHFTLQLLREIKPEQIPDIIQAIETVAAHQPAFGLTLAGVGGFPSLERPRVLWLGIQQGQESIFALKAALDSQLLPLGFTPEDRGFHPHLTLARPGRRGDPRPIAMTTDLEAFQAVANQSHLMSVTEVCFFQSQLTPAGPVYQKLATVALLPAE